MRAHASETALKNIAVATADTLQDVMRFDHNPQLTRLTNTIGDGALSNIPTRGACCIDLGMGVLIENMWKLHGKNRCVEVSPKAHSLNSELLLALGRPAKEIYSHFRNRQNRRIARFTIRAPEQKAQRIITIVIQNFI